MHVGQREHDSPPACALLQRKRMPSGLWSWHCDVFSPEPQWHGSSAVLIIT